VRQLGQRGDFSNAAFAACAALIGALAFACQASTDTTVLSWADNGRTIVAAVGDQIEVALNVVGPYYYGSPSISSSSVQLLKQWEELPTQPIPGGPKTLRYLFEATAVGHADIAILRDVPGATEPSGFEITVEVY
jgi:hypothetical protein